MIIPYKKILKDKSQKIVRSKTIQVNSTTKGKGIPLRRVGEPNLRKEDISFKLKTEVEHVITISHHRQRYKAYFFPFQTKQPYTSSQELDR